MSTKKFPLPSSDNAIPNNYNSHMLNLVIKIKRLLAVNTQLCGKGTTSTKQMKLKSQSKSKKNFK